MKYNPKNLDIEDDEGMISISKDDKIIGRVLGYNKYNQDIRFQLFNPLDQIVLNDKSRKIFAEKVETFAGKLPSFVSFFMG